MNGRTVTVVGAGTTRASLGNVLGDRNSNPQVLIDAAVELTRLVVAAAAAAWEMAGLGAVNADGAECWLGTLYGTGHVGEYYTAALHRPRPLLNPRAFTFSCLNSVGGAVSSALKLTGGAVTIVGHNAGADALAHGCRSLELGHTEHVVCGAFDFPSPFASAALQARGITVSPSEGAAAVLVLTLEDKGRHRGVPLIAITDGDDGCRDASEPEPVDEGVSPAVTPLLGMATALARDQTDRVEPFPQRGAEPHQPPAIPSPRRRSSQRQLEGRRG
jgi:3-oxoacyl-(acyl-carrier-protein) synthase